MRAVQVERPGGPEVLTGAEAPDPEPGPGELVVEVSAAGVNYIDTYQRDGTYPVPMPFTPGLEIAGTVCGLGPGVTRFQVGDVVASADARGGYAQRAVVPEERAVQIPAGLDPTLAAAGTLQGLTAHYLMTSTYRVQPGDAVLVHAAAGGVGLLLCQLGRRLGARVIATVSTEEKAELARRAGAAEVIRYTEEPVPERVRSLTDGAGVAVVYDGVGATTFDGSLDSLRPRGTLALFGAASGPVPPVDPQLLNRKGSLYLTRPSLAHYVAAREELLARAEEVYGWLADGSLEVRVGGRYDLADARRAHEDLQGRRTTGKLLLLPGGGS
jgi:NADPH2:quinone reductase